jgi:predicted nuclease of predicted toxin-antitoxin system
VSRPALLANENVPLPAIQVLRNAGVRVVSVAESMPRASDKAVLAHAVKHALWILTFDRDYGEPVFAREAAPPPAILYVRQGPRPAIDFGQDILALLDDPTFALGHLVVVSGRRLRRRALPA